MQRREFLVTAAAGAAAIARMSPRARAQAAQRASQAKLDRIAIMTLNFQQLLKVPDTQPSPERTLELFDLPAMIADTYGVHKVEFQHYHIASTEPAYLKDLRAAIEKSKSRMTQINVEFGADLTFSVPSQRYRTMTVDLTKRWVDHAVALGAQRVIKQKVGLKEAAHGPRVVELADQHERAALGVADEVIGPLRHHPVA